MKRLVYCFAVMYAALGTTAANADYMYGVELRSSTISGAAGTSGSFDLFLVESASGLDTPRLTSGYNLAGTTFRIGIVDDSVATISSVTAAAGLAGTSTGLGTGTVDFQFAGNAAPVGGEVKIGTVGLSLLAMGSTTISLSDNPSQAAGEIGLLNLGGVPPFYSVDFDAPPAGVTASFGSGTISVSAVPEPSSLALLGLGAFGFAFRRRRA